MRSTLVPKTKLHPPALRQPMVLRPRLTDVFVDHRPLTVVSAPAGSGKTTLVLEWLAFSNANIAWLALDADDNDPIRFIHGVIAAFQSAGIKLKLPSGQRTLKTTITNIINQLNDAASIALVLDDYHVITDGSIHSALSYLLEHIPASLQLVLVTREEPPLPLARLRARAQLREFTLRDLRFTVDETDQFLNHVMGLDLSDEQVQAMGQNTQGWAAGLQMAGLSLQANQDVSFANEKQFIADYLLAEVFTRQSKDVQNFLLSTSILERFSLPLCRALIPKNAAKLLGQVQRANLFISTIGTWHQYHPVFLEFLQTQLQNEFPERAKELHRSAIIWMEDNGMIADAIPHAFAISDFETAARLIASLAPDYLKQGELVTLRRWLERLPESTIWHYPRLCLTQIWLLLDSNLQLEAQQYFDRLGSFLEKNLRSEFLAVRALHAAMTHQPELAMKFAKKAQRSPEAKDPFIQTYVSFGMGAAQKMGLNFFQAEQSFRDSLAYADADKNSYIAVSSLVNLADVLYLQARLFDTENICKSGIKRFGEDSPDARDCFWNLARVNFMHNKLDAALKHINEAITLSEEAEEQMLQARALLERALIHYGLDKKRLAQTDLDTADQLVRGLQDQVVLRAIVRQRVLFALDDGDVASARKWLKALFEYSEQPYPFFHAYAKGRVLLAEKKFKEARSSFETALKDLENVDFALVRIEVMIWYAVCLSELGKKAEAAKMLKGAVKASQTEKIIRPFVDAKDEVLSLVDKTGRDGFDWVLDQVEENRKQAEGPALTRREREILQLLSTGLSNQEMAERLFIAEGTLKRHVANLYQKLGVHNRTQAVRHFHLQ